MSLSCDFPSPATTASLQRALPTRKSTDLAGWDGVHMDTQGVFFRHPRNSAWLLANTEVQPTKLPLHKCRRDADNTDIKSQRVGRVGAKYKFRVTRMGVGFQKQTKFSLLKHPDRSSKLRMWIKWPYTPYTPDTNFRQAEYPKINPKESTGHLMSNKSLQGFPPQIRSPL